jgi:uncharacterized protein Yka (UPF0111/DUF47 family)
MFSLQRFLSKGQRFFDLLEASAEEARQSVHALIELIDVPRDGRTLEQFVLRRRQEKQLHEQITALVCSTLITPLEREDIEDLANALSRITKSTKKFAQRFLMSQSCISPQVFCQQARLLQQATDTLCQMVQRLRHSPNLNKVQEENGQLHQFEGEADKLMIELLGDIYSGKYDARQMVVARDLIELLEKVIDRCRDAGNIVFRIVLKNS